ncbi:MAG: aminoacetone oxidase family FAD-binding enzyme [Clostridia bacterium]|nr:aminoacetone oxidase family FAD-binding enzyme [Clostridia bacterium]
MFFDVAIIGGGMSGLVSAIEVKRNYPEKSVVIFEKLDRVGKKILATGNGRCNLDNLTATKEDYNSPSFVSFTLEKYTPESNLDFWKSLGLLTVADSEGRVYPRSNSASSVLDALRFETEKLGIKIIFEKAEKLDKKDVFIINNNIKAEKVIVCCGGCSSPSQGSDGSGFRLLKTFRCRNTPLYPSLVQITTDTRFTKPLKGVRVKGRLTLTEKEKFIGKADGEILFADYGLSGIATMDLSRFLRKVSDIQNARIYLDMACDMEEKELLSYLVSHRNKNSHLECENFLSGILPKAMGKTIMKKCGIFLGDEAGKLTDKDIKNIIENIKNLELKVTGTKGFEFSQVTSGGIDLKEVDKFTMMSERVNDLYFCGEILDVDSRCGGFNLHWAVSSARLAAELKG